MEILASKGVSFDGHVLTGDVLETHFSARWAELKTSNPSQFVLEFIPVHADLRYDIIKKVIHNQEAMPYGYTDMAIGVHKQGTPASGAELLLEAGAYDNRGDAQLPYNGGPLTLRYRKRPLMLRFECQEGQCEVTVAGLSEDDYHVPFIRAEFPFRVAVREDFVTPPAVVQVMNAMYTERLFHDASIIADGETIPVHRSVLAGVSPVMRRMFEGRFREGTEAQITLPSSSSTAHALVDHMYGREVPSDVDAAELFEVALMYDLRPLQDMCVDYLAATPSVAVLVAGLRRIKSLREDPQAECAHQRLRQEWVQRLQQCDAEGREAMLEMVDL